MVGWGIKKGDNMWFGNPGSVVKKWRQLVEEREAAGRNDNHHSVPVDLGDLKVMLIFAEEILAGRSGVYPQKPPSDDMTISEFFSGVGWSKLE